MEVDLQRLPEVELVDVGERLVSFTGEMRTSMGSSDDREIPPQRLFNFLVKMITIKHQQNEMLGCYTWLTHDNETEEWHRYGGGLRGLPLGLSDVYQ